MKQASVCSLTQGRFHNLQQFFFAKMKLAVLLVSLLICLSVFSAPVAAKRAVHSRHKLFLKNRGHTKRLLDQKVVDEIKSYQAIADQIIAYSLSGAGANQSYNRLAEFTDLFGNRVAGSDNLEKAIDHLLGVRADDGLDNVHGEKVNVTHWVRNNEYATLLSP